MKVSIFRSLVAATLVALAAQANAAIIVNEFLGSTTSSDPEFIELYNTGGTTVDISDYSIELWDSDSGGAFGGSDGDSPYVIPATTTIAPGDYYVLGTSLSETVFSYTADQTIDSNAIENSSYTLILKDENGDTLESWFVTDGGASDAANDAGVLITPDFVADDPGGNFVAAGVFRSGDGASTFGFLEFSPQQSPSATPGAANPSPVVIPEPGSFLLIVLSAAFAGMVRLRRVWG
ncbi:MAG: lamin tail domain-containing protein [Planctomycetota bacterium]